MKKLLKSTVTVMATQAVALFLSCGGKDNSPNPVNCSNNAEKVSTAGTTWANNPNTANCEAYKNAVRDLYKSCANYYTGQYKQELDEFLASPCN